METTLKPFVLKISQYKMSTHTDAAVTLQQKFLRGGGVLKMQNQLPLRKMAKLALGLSLEDT